METEDEFRYRLAFSAFEGIGPARFRLLIKYFGSPKVAYRAKENQLLKVGLSDKTVSRLVDFREKFDPDSYILRLEKMGIRALSSDDKKYPTLLKEIDNPPIILYVKSRQGLDLGKVFSLPCLAVVGSRKLSSYGRQVTQMMVNELAQNGFCIVSGLALGVDGVAHRAAMENYGKTIAVMGCGLDVVYPAAHRRLADDILQSGGLWVSEYPLEARALPGNFPNRNRVISGLSLGVIVTEAAEDSGSLITARFASEQGREVFAVPGPITSQVSNGTLYLLKHGVIPVGKVDDILECLPGFRKTKEKVKTGQFDDLTETELRIVDLLKSGERSLDKMVEELVLPADKLASCLSLLEVKGLVTGDGGKYYLNGGR